MTEEQQVAPSEATEETVVSQETSEATENTEGQAESPPAEGEAPEDEKSESAKRRERRRAQQERLRAETEQARKALAEKEARLQHVRQRAEQSNTPPKEGDFADYNEYLIAMGAYHAAKSMDSRELREVEEAAKADQERVKRIEQMRDAEIAQNWSDQAAEARTRYADFDKVVPYAPISDTVARMIAQSDMGADVAYHLGTRPNEAIALSRLADFDPIEAARELGRLEARLSLPKPNMQTNAPDPVNPVKPKPSGIKDPRKMSFEEYREARMSGKLR